VRSLVIEYARRNLSSAQDGGASLLEIADFATKLADLYFANDEFDQAEPLYWQSLEMRRKELGVVHLKVASSLQDLAELYEMQAKHGKAEQLYECVIGIMTELPQATDPEAVTCLRRVAGYYESRGLDSQRFSVEDLSTKFGSDCELSA
jgi:hypothetical protein